MADGLTETGDRTIYCKEVDDWATWPYAPFEAQPVNGQMITAYSADGAVDPDVRDVGQTGLGYEQADSIIPAGGATSIGLQIDVYPTIRDFILVADSAVSIQIHRVIIAGPVDQTPLGDGTTPQTRDMIIHVDLLQNFSQGRWKDDGVLGDNPDNPWNQAPTRVADYFIAGLPFVASISIPLTISDTVRDSFLNSVLRDGNDDNGRLAFNIWLESATAGQHVILGVVDPGVVIGTPLDPSEDEIPQLVFEDVGIIGVTGAHAETGRDGLHFNVGQSRVDRCPKCGRATLRETWVMDGFTKRLVCPECYDPEDREDKRRPIRPEDRSGINPQG